MPRYEKQWVNAKEEKPKRGKWFDLCFLDLGDKVVNGWWNGTAWKGLHYRGEEVNRWKYIL